MYVKVLVKSFRVHFIVPIDSPRVVFYSTCIDPSIVSVTVFEIFDV